MDTLFPGLNDNSHTQAQLGLKAGGIGNRAAQTMAKAASLAAQTVARPKLQSFAQTAQMAGLFEKSTFDNALTTRYHDTASADYATLDQTETEHVQAFLEEVKQKAQIKWEAQLLGHEHKKAECPTLNIKKIFYCLRRMRIAPRLPKTPMTPTTGRQI